MRKHFFGNVINNYCRPSYYNMSNNVLPVSLNERSDILDVVRGFALLGRGSRY